MRAALYARVSLDKQQEGYSIPTQLAEMRKYAEANGLEVVAEFIEDESGATLERPALEQVRRAVERGEFDVLICFDLDRLGRSLAHQILLEEEFAKHHVEVRYVLGEYKDTAEGRLSKHIKAVIAEYEREKLLERTSRGRRGRAVAGNINVGRQAPYGYVYCHEGRRGWLEVVPEEAEVVREIFQAYVYEALSLYEIARRLSERGVPSAGDRPAPRPTKRKLGYGQWHATSVGQILQNEVYVGVWYENKCEGRARFRPRSEWIPVAVPAIVSRELFEAAQHRRADNRERRRRKARHPYLLTGMLRCGKCSGAFVGATTGFGKNGAVYRYYRCNAHSPRSCNNGRCQQLPISGHEADALVWGRVVEMLTHPELLWERFRSRRSAGSQQRLQKQLSEVENSLQGLVAQRQRWLHLYVAGEADMTLVKQEQDKVRSRMATLERERDALKQELSEGEDDDALAASFISFCQTVSQGIDSLSVEEKRQVLRLLNIQGTVTGRTISLTGSFPVASAPAGGDGRRGYFRLREPVLCMLN